MKQPGNAHRADVMRRNFPFPQIASSDLDVAIIGQLAATNLPLGDEFEPSPMKVISLKGIAWVWGC
jgi:hypothetical protein